MRAPTSPPLVIVLIHDIWMRQLVQNTLTSHGYRALSASNGFSGLRLQNLQAQVDSLSAQVGLVRSTLSAADAALGSLPASNAADT